MNLQGDNGLLLTERISNLDWIGIGIDRVTPSNAVEDAEIPDSPMLEVFG